MLHPTIVVSRASYCRSRVLPICTLRALSFRQVEPTCLHKRRERSSHNQKKYSFVQRDTPSHLAHNLISLHHPNLTHQWTSSLQFSPLKVSLTLPSLSALSSPPVPFPLTWNTMVAQVVFALLRRRHSSPLYDTRPMPTR